MKRRDFLKILGAAPAIAAIPALAKTNKDELKFKFGRNPYYEEEIRKYTYSKPLNQTSWEPIKQSEIDVDSPITKTIRVTLKDRDVYSKADVRQLIDGINEEIEKKVFIGDKEIGTISNWDVSKV